jgi:hypothetical protein
MKRWILFVLVASSLPGLTACKKQGNTEKANPWVGAWKLDTGRSKLHEAPKQETMQIDSADKNSLKYSIRGISDEGKEYTENYDGKPDGNSYPVTVNGKELGKIGFLWQSERVCTAQGKGLGGSSLTETATLSDDGKTITIKSREGKEEEETAVYTK